jgi:hypothetical protein
MVNIVDNTYLMFNTVATQLERNYNPKLFLI